VRVTGEFRILFAREGPDLRPVRARIRFTGNSSESGYHRPNPDCRR
jgi:hypothetical protein